MWVVRMDIYLGTLDLWEAVEEKYDIPALLVNPTMAQMKVHKERKTRKSKAKSCFVKPGKIRIF